MLLASRALRTAAQQAARLHTVSMPYNAIKVSSLLLGDRDQTQQRLGSALQY